MPKIKSTSYLDLTWNGKLEQRERTFRITKLLNRDRSWYYLGLIGEVGFSIAVPIVGGALLGKVLDQKFQIYPKGTMSLLMFGLFISIVNLITIVKELIKK